MNQLVADWFSRLVKEQASSRREIKAVMCSLMDVSQLLLRQAASLLAEEGVLYCPIRRD